MYIYGKATLVIEESEQKKCTANISYKMQFTLNQIVRLANIHSLPFVTYAIREYISRTNEYFKTGTWCEKDFFIISVARTIRQCKFFPSL